MRELTGLTNKQTESSRNGASSSVIKNSSTRNPSHQQPVLVHQVQVQVQVNPHASFSQAFGNDDDDNATIGTSTSTSTSTRTSTRQGNASVQQNQQNTNTTASTRTLPSSSNSNSNSNSNARTAASANANTALDDPALLQPHVLHVSTKQRGNGILRYIRNVPFAYAKITPDYIVGPNRCALFLSLKYHNLHPNYVHRRIAELRSDFDLRILLCLVDVQDNAAILLFLNKLCCVNNMTLILAWSEQEVARYLETFKAFEAKDASTIQKKKQVTFEEQIADTLGCIRSVNKTDAATLTSQFGNLKHVMTASVEDIRLCPGIGEKKARRLYEAFHKPFSSAMAKKRKAEQEKKIAEMEDGMEHDEIDAAVIEELDSNSAS